MNVSKRKEAVAEKAGYVFTDMTSTDITTAYCSHTNWPSVSSQSGELMSVTDGTGYPLDAHSPECDHDRPYDIKLRSYCP